MLRGLKNLVRNSVSLYCASVLLFDAMQGLQLKLGRNKRMVGTMDGGGHADAASTVARIAETIDAYRQGGEIRGRVVEVGPGDNLGVALMLLNGGATQVDAADRFAGLRPWNGQKPIYEALAAQFGIRDYLDASGTALKQIDYQAGQSAEEYFQHHPARYDGIYSFSVMEHVIDPMLCLELMRGAMKPGGRMVHVVDFSAHGMFAGHPLTFLTISEGIYRRMVKNGGRPNRYMLDRYKDWIARSGLEATVLVRYLVDGTKLAKAAVWENIDPALRRRALDKVAEIRPRMAALFKDVADEDLAVAEAIVVIQG